jgi:hypothetical protein
MSQVKKFAQEAPTLSRPRQHQSQQPVTAPAASPAPVATGDEVPTLSHPRRNRQNQVQQPSGGTTSSSSFASIKQLQQAILNFANVASSSDVTSMTGNQAGKQESSSGEYLGGSDPFGDFVASHIKEAPTSGQAQQYLNTDVASPDRSRMGIEDTGLRGIIDTLKRIGTPGKENAPDGVWKQRTNNALWQIAKVMVTIDNLSTAMQVPLEGLGKLVAAFQQAIPKVYTDIDDQAKAQLAPELTKMVEQMTEFFGQFKNSVLSNKHLRKYIDQQKPFVQYQQKTQSGTNALSPEEKQLYVSNVNTPIPNLQLGKTPVSLVDLESMDNFKTLMQKAGLNTNDPVALQSALSQIAQGLGVATSSTEQTQQQQTAWGY